MDEYQPDTAVTEQLPVHAAHAGSPAAAARRTPEELALAMVTGPSGRRYDSAPRLLAAAGYPAGLEVMYDGPDAAFLPEGAGVYAGRFDGPLSTMDAIAARFPDARLVSLTADPASTYAMYLDVGPGRARAAHVPGFLRGGGLGFLAAPSAAAGYSVDDCISECAFAGLPRPSYRIWSFHLCGRHLCNPRSCGHPAADGTCYLHTPGWSESVVSSQAFFTSVIQPAGPPRRQQPLPAPALPPPGPAGPAPRGWVSWSTDGKTSLAQAAAARGQTVAAVLAGTFERGAGPELRAYLTAVFAGITDPAGPLPEGLVLWRKEAAPPAEAAA
jgi:hypothetical protein